MPILAPIITNNPKNSENEEKKKPHITYIYTRTYHGRFDANSIVQSSENQRFSVFTKRKKKLDSSNEIKL